MSNGGDAGKLEARVLRPFDVRWVARNVHAKLKRHGPFDMSLYKPIQVEDLGGGRYMIMDGMTTFDVSLIDSFELSKG